MYLFNSSYMENIGSTEIERKPFELMQKQVTELKTNYNIMKSHNLRMITYVLSIFHAY